MYEGKGFSFLRNYGKGLVSCTSRLRCCIERVKWMESESKREKMRVPSGAMLSPNLPNDIMLEILARQPVKSLLRFKRVSRSWYAHISKNPNLISKHLHHTRITGKDTVFLTKRIVRDKSVHYFKTLCVFSLIYCCTETGYVECIDLDDVNVACLKGLKMKYVSIVPPCNGLVCLTYEAGELDRYYCEVFVLNPSVGGESNFKALPLSPSPPPPPGFVLLKNGKIVIAFGFDCKNSAYKVVRIWPFVSKSIFKECVNKVEVCTLGDDSECWREIDAMPLTPLRERNDYGCDPLYANGKCYWKNEFSMPHNLVSFDFADEVFEEIELPNAAGIVQTGGESWRNIMALNDSIALISYPLEVNEKCFEVWLTNKEPDGGGRLSWTKYITVELPNSNLHPLTLLANGFMVLQNKKQDELHLYNSANGVIKHLEIDCDGLRDLLVYNESLVSFKEWDVLLEHGNEVV